MDHHDELDLVIQRELKAARTKVWKAWTTPDLIAQWWAPKPWKTEVVQLDVRPQGGFQLDMIGPDGERYSGPGCFLHVEPQLTLVWTSGLAAGWRPIAKPDFPLTCTITMKDHGTGTQYTAHVLHASKEHVKQHKEMGFLEGWNTCISQLDELAQALED